MTTTEYPKIETLFDRDKDTFTVIEGAFRLPEFDMIKTWHVTEKIDGQNIRVMYTPEVRDVVFEETHPATLTFNGRTDKAQMQKNVQELLDFLFPSVEPFKEMFTTGATIYGEAYGAGVQKGGNYRSSVGFRIFDVCVGGIFLNWDNVTDIADRLGVSTVPVLSPPQGCTTEQAIRLVPFRSDVGVLENGAAFEQEGIIARTDPGLLTRSGRRVMWKLKNSDYRAGKR